MRPPHSTLLRPLVGYASVLALVVAIVAASGTWTCDESDANDGDELLAFVREGELLHDGRGRMPVLNRDGRRRVGVWGDVRLPPELRSEANPEPNHRFSRTVDLEDLRYAVGTLEPRGPVVTLR